MRTIAAVALVLAGSAYAQDLSETVKTAVEGKRFALRRAAAARLAQAGDEAVLPLRAYLAEHDRNTLPLELVDSIARAESPGPGVRVMLRDWAGDREFYWRAQSLGGLARAADHADADRFRAALNDPSHLCRIEGARGLLAVSDTDADRDAVRSLLADDDPRARLRVALALFAREDRSGTEMIFDAVRGADRKFLDDPFGSREAQEVVRTLRDTGHDFSAAAGGPGPERDAALQSLAEFLGVKDGRHAGRAEPDVLARCDNGIEVRSCRNGDLFLRWSWDGTLCVGLDPVKVLQLDPSVVGELREALRAEADTKVHGVVICDYLRLRCVVDDHTLAHHKCAPSAVPESIARWLKRLAAAIEKTDTEAGVCPLSDRLAQFLARTTK